MNTTQVKVHPAAELLPMMDEEQYAGFKEDIRQNGCKEPIVFWNNQLLDGRNRLKACQELGIVPQEEECDVDLVDPLQYVITHNLHRRHLTTSQRAAVAASMKSFKRGEIGNGRKVESQICSSTMKTKDIAASLGVSKRSINDARVVKERGSEELQKAVESGDVSVSRAAKVAKSATPKVNHLEAAKSKVKTDKPERDKKTGPHVHSELYTQNVARVSITQLESIPKKNKFRINALKTVMNYIEQQISEAAR